MSTTLYGPGDSFDLKTAHVVPPPIRRFPEAKKATARSVTLCGKGSRRRALNCVDDLAVACPSLLDVYGDREHINVGVGSDATTAGLAQLVAEVVGRSGGTLQAP